MLFLENRMGFGSHADDPLWRPSVIVFGTTGVVWISMSLHPEQQYLDLMAQALHSGDPRVDRTGVGTLSLFGAMMRFDLSDGTVPILTTKRV